MFLFRSQLRGELPLTVPVQTRSDLARSSGLLQHLTKDGWRRIMNLEGDRHS